MKVCEFETCDREARAKNLCRGHYMQQWQGRALTPLGSTKGRTTGAFTVRDISGLSHGKVYTYQQGCRCLECKSAISLAGKERYLAHKSVDKQQLLKKQKGRCACCGVAGKSLVLDHIHGTSTVRGLLCQNCNAGIGKLGDDLDGVMKAVSYLKSVRI